MSGNACPVRGVVPRVPDLTEQLHVYLDLGFDVAGVGIDDLQQRATAESYVVFPHSMVPVQELISGLHLAGKTKRGIFDRNFEDPDRYHPVDPSVPRDRPYLVHGFEPGVEYLNLPPREALPALEARGRLPMTIEEGLAVFATNPGVLQRNRCFSLAGSSRGDKRVPALWISAHAPKLGWCFAGAPHTWLGTASIAGRVA